MHIQAMILSRPCVACSVMVGKDDYTLNGIGIIPCCARCKPAYNMGLEDATRRLKDTISVRLKKAGIPQNIIDEACD